MYRELIFESAEHVIAEKGYDDATMQEIAAEAGISLKTLYATFPGKRELYSEIQEVRGDQFVETIARSLSAEASPLEMLELGVRAYVEFLAKHQDFLRIHLHEGKAWGLRPEGAVSEDWQRGVEAFSVVIQKGIEEGIFFEGDPLMMAMMGIAIMQVQLTPVADRVREIDTDKLAQEILLQLHRILCRPGGDRQQAS